MSISVAAHARFTFREYVALENASPVKHEYLSGQVYAMAGGTPEHAAISARLARLIGNALAGRPCNVYTSDLRVRVTATGLTTYPDLTVICERLVPDPEDPNTAINPVLLVEVLSESTADYDRGEKIAHYKRIEGLREILLVAQDCRRLERWRREKDHSWSLAVAGPSESLRIETANTALAVDAVYTTGF